MNKLISLSIAALLASVVQVAVLVIDLKAKGHQRRWKKRLNLIDGWKIRRECQ